MYQLIRFVFGFFPSFEWSNFLLVFMRVLLEIIRDGSETNSNNKKKLTPREKGQTKRSVVHHVCRARAHKLKKRGKWIVVVDAGSFAWTEIIKGERK